VGTVTFLDTSAEGCIVAGSPEARALGFTADLFHGYLWRKGNVLYISFIVSRYPGQGNFRNLMDRLEEGGCHVKVPCPSAWMEHILKVRGYKQHFEWAEEVGEDVEMWEL